MGAYLRKGPGFVPPPNRMIQRTIPLVPSQLICLEAIPNRDKVMVGAADLRPELLEIQTLLCPPFVTSYKLLHLQPIPLDVS